jgi:hypothetical protein
MKLTKEHKAILKSAVRHFILVAIPVWEVSGGDVKAFVYGLVAAIVGPSIRAIDKHDPVFGKLAEVVEKELAKKPARRKKTK